MSKDTKKQGVRKKELSRFTIGKAISELTGYSVNYVNKVLKGKHSNYVIEYYARMYKKSKRKFQEAYMKRQEENRSIIKTLKLHPDLLRAISLLLGKSESVVKSEILSMRGPAFRLYVMSQEDFFSFYKMCDEAGVLSQIEQEKIQNKK